METEDITFEEEVEERNGGELRHDNDKNAPMDIEESALCMVKTSHYKKN